MPPAAAPPASALGAAVQLFATGDRVPNFLLPDATGTGRDFYAEVSGRPALLLLADTIGSGQGLDLWLLLKQRQAELAGLDVELFLVTGDAPQRPDPAAQPRTLAVQDPGAGLSGRFLEGKPVRLLALDPNQRILTLADGDAERQFALCRAAVEAWRTAQGSRQRRQGGAPVLLLPRVLSPELCSGLIGLWTRQNREGAVSAGSTENFEAADRKRTREHDVTDPETTRQVARSLVRRVVPELAKVFNFTQRTTMERFIVMGYDADRRDFFARHRDRYLPEHPRRFALSLNLNEGYSGGELRFPEYSEDLYCPPAGGGCVFSCSLLHEALPVSQGTRFVMTTFFHAAEGPVAAPR